MHELRKKQIDEPVVLARHHKHVGGAPQEILAERLAAERAEFHALGRHRLHGVAARRLALRGAEAGGLDTNLGRSLAYAAEQGLGHGTAADIAGANKQNVALRRLVHADWRSLVRHAFKSNAGTGLVSVSPLGVSLLLLPPYCAEPFSQFCAATHENTCRFGAESIPQPPEQIPTFRYCHRSIALGVFLQPARSPDHPWDARGCGHCHSNPRGACIVIQSTLDRRA